MRLQQSLKIAHATCAMTVVNDSTANLVSTSRGRLQSLDQQGIWPLRGVGKLNSSFPLEKNASLAHPDTKEVDSIPESPESGVSNVDSTAKLDIQSNLDSVVDLTSAPNWPPAQPKKNGRRNRSATRRSAAARSQSISPQSNTQSPAEPQNTTNNYAQSRRNGWLKQPEPSSNSQAVRRRAQSVKSGPNAWFPQRNSQKAQLWNANHSINPDRMMNTLGDFQLVVRENLRLVQEIRSLRAQADSFSAIELTCRKLAETAIRYAIDGPKAVANFLEDKPEKLSDNIHLGSDECKVLFIKIIQDLYKSRLLR